MFVGVVAAGLLAHPADGVANQLTVFDSVAAEADNLMQPCNAAFSFFENAVYPQLEPSRLFVGAERMWIECGSAERALSEVGGTDQLTLEEKQPLSLWLTKLRMNASVRKDLANLTAMYRKDRREDFLANIERLTLEDAHNSTVALEFRTTAHDALLEASTQPAKKVRPLSKAHQRDLKAFIKRVETMGAVCTANSADLERSTSPAFDRRAMAQYTEPAFRECGAANASISRVTVPKSLPDDVGGAIEGWAMYMAELARARQEMARAAGFYVESGRPGDIAVYRHQQMSENDKKRNARDFWLEAHRLAGLPY